LEAATAKQNEDRPTLSTTELKLNGALKVLFNDCIEYVAIAGRS